MIEADQTDSRSYAPKQVVEKQIQIFLNIILRSPKLSRHILQKISPNPSFPKRGIPPFCKGREGGI
jgi:hypothetical protein